MKTTLLSAATLVLLSMIATAVSAQNSWTFDMYMDGSNTDACYRQSTSPSLTMSAAALDDWTIDIVVSGYEDDCQ